MKISTILKLIESIENDEKQTYEDIRNGEHYELYFNDLLKAKWEFMEYLTKNDLMLFDINYIKEKDKEKYDDIIKD